MQLSYSRLIFYLAAIFITSSISSGATDHKKQPRMAASTAGGDSRIFDIKSNSAQEGVNLLEQIMQKMHNMPQIALNNTRQTIVLKSPLLADNALPGMSSYDYLKNAQEQSLPVAGPMSNASAHVAEMQSTAQGFKQVRGNLLHQPDRKNFNQYPEATGTATARQGTLLAKKTEISQASAHSFDPNNPAPRLQGASSASIGPREYQIVDQRPVVRDFRVARDAFSAPGTIIGSLAGRNGMSTAVGAGAVMGGVYGTTASVFHAKHSVKERATLPTNNLDIALSPPGGNHGYSSNKAW